MSSSSPTVAVEGAAAAYRLAVIGKTGIFALWGNKKVFMIACFASFGGFVYGYQQGVLGQALAQYNFTHTFADTVNSSRNTGWLTSILQLGGWLGALSSGILAEIFSRKYTIFIGALWVILGSGLMAGSQNVGYLYAGRWFTGIGVGTLSAAGPLYNSELSPPELRGLIVGLQQFTTCFGIMAAYWIGYGTNYIGDTGAGQSDFAWRTPMIIQGVPAVILAIGVWFLPFSPRFLAKRNRDDEALRTISYLRGLPVEHDLVRIEFLEIKSEAVFEQRALERRTSSGGSSTNKNLLMHEINGYLYCFQTMDNFKRVAYAGVIMFFQQWTGVDAIVYYATDIFKSVGLTSGTTSLLATGVTGVVLVLATIPTLMIIDKLGRKPVLLSGSVSMFCAMLIVGIIVAKCQHDWDKHAAAGWAAVAFIWIYMASFAFSWGPASWILIAEICPLSIRAKGTAIGASSNWMNNFIVAFVVPPMLRNISWGTYLVFCVFLALGVGFVWFFLPETKGKTLEEMDAVFGSHQGVADAEELGTIQRELGLVEAIERAAGRASLATAEEKGPEAVHQEGYKV